VGSDGSEGTRCLSSDALPRRDGRSAVRSPRVGISVPAILPAVPAETNREPIIDATRNFPQMPRSRTPLNGWCSWRRSRRGWPQLDAGQAIPHDEVKRRQGL
jgi:hypothetical protein